MPLQHGALERKYVFEYDVGEWTFGAIQVVREKASGELRTCKTVPKASVRGARDVLARLKALRELQHPHICSILDVMEDDDHFFIFFEFTQGGDVQDWMERLDEGHWLQEQTCAAYIRQAMLALAHSHAVHVYHRDLRPSCLQLTTKLPDAVVKVCDFGLATILDPDNRIIQKHPTPYTDPSVLRNGKGDADGAADMWSIGTIARALLVGCAPAESSPPAATTGWGLARSVYQSADEDGWNDRSPLSLDFTQRLLRPTAGDRPTAAKALNHPWLKGLTPLCGVNFRADNEVARDLRNKTLCYTLGALLLPAVLPYRDFERLRMAFQQADTDGDGFVPRAVGHRILLGRCNLVEAVIPALNIVDVAKTDTLDLCALAVSDLIVREFFGAGPTSQPLLGPFSASDLAPRLLRRFFETFGDRQQGSPQASIKVANVRAKLRTATARDVEAHAHVSYVDLLASLPDDRAFSSQELAQHLAASAGKGTPLANDGELSPVKTGRLEAPWTMGDIGSGLGSALGFDVSGMIQSCGFGLKRFG